jgi:hypothetical protein
MDLDTKTWRYNFRRYLYILQVYNWSTTKRTEIAIFQFKTDDQKAYKPISSNPAHFHNFFQIQEIKRNNREIQRKIVGILTVGARTKEVETIEIKERHQTVRFLVNQLISPSICNKRCLVQWNLWVWLVGQILPLFTGARSSLTNVC